MKLETKIKSVEAAIQENKLVLKSKTPLKILSSAVLNGGLLEANSIVSVHVPEETGLNVDDNVHMDAGEFLRTETAKLGIPQDQLVGIMTAAKMKNVDVATSKFEDITLTAIATAGVHFAATAGDAIASRQSAFPPMKWGTINIIVLVDGDLTDSCMVNAVSTITEAKTVALRELDVRSRFSGEIATSTVTDSVVLACTKKGQKIEFAGTATPLGELIGKSVRKAVKEALRNQENIVSDRPLVRRLKERGITVENMTTLFSQISSILDENDEARMQFIAEVKKALSDQNIAALVIAGLRLDEDAKTGLIPENPANEYGRNFVLSKILQKAVTDYLSKENKAYKYVRPDYLSSIFAEKMGWFTRSILSAVMYSVYSDFLEKHAKEQKE
jgi:iron complex transport system ATP-binding protein